jgi:hypothetical protein
MATRVEFPNRVPRLVVLTRHVAGAPDDFRERTLLMMRSILVGILVLMAAGIGWLTFDWYRNQNSGQAFGAPFVLVDQKGAEITEAAFRGQPSAVFFGFTHCPEVCPTTLFELALPESVQSLVAALETEESLRIKNRIAQGLLDRRWPVPEDQLATCKQALPNDYRLDGSLIARR